MKLLNSLQQPQHSSTQIMSSALRTKCQGRFLFKTLLMPPHIMSSSAPHLLRPYTVYSPCASCWPAAGSAPMVGAPFGGNQVENRSPTSCSLLLINTGEFQQILVKYSTPDRRPEAWWMPLCSVSARTMAFSSLCYLIYGCKEKLSRNMVKSGQNIKNHNNIQATSFP